MSTPSQLLLLSDHIKLSLLERQRAISLDLVPNPTQESHVARSLESLREGLDTLASKSDPPDDDTLRALRSQYNDLSRQFHGDNLPSTAAETLSSPNDPSLAADFRRASSIDQERPPRRPGSSLKPRAEGANVKPSPKSVRFRDNPSSSDVAVNGEDDDHNRAALFPSRYTDAEPPTAPDPTSEMDNQQIHEYHQQVLQEQDDQLDRLGESIGRQRHLSIQIGDELEGQVALLDQVDSGVDRHQSRLDGAKRRLKGVSKKASQNWGMTTIIVLIVVLVLLIVALK